MSKVIGLDEKSMTITGVENGYKVEAKGHLFVSKKWELIDKKWLEVGGAADATKECREVKLKKADNGFVVKVGCVEFVAHTWKEVSDALQEYWTDPMAAETKYCKKRIEEMATLVDKASTSPISTEMELE